jgi:hypothetical protein
MITRAAVDEALNIHASWKNRLQDAIVTQQSEVTVDDVKRDDRCPLGVWLHALSPDDMRTGDFELVHSLHAQFHEAAAEVLSRALEGKVSEALRMLEYNGAYEQISANLVRALGDWKQKLAV